MAESTIGGIPSTIVFTLIISFFAFFSSVTCVTLYFYKRNPRRLERLRQLEQAAEFVETFPLGIWAEAPKIWEVWVDRHPKHTSNWEDLLVRLPFMPSPVFFFQIPRSQTSFPASQLDIRAGSTRNPRIVTYPTEQKFGVGVPQCSHE